MCIVKVVLHIDSCQIIYEQELNFNKIVYIHWYKTKKNIYGLSTKIFYKVKSSIHDEFIYYIILLLNTFVCDCCNLINEILQITLLIWMMLFINIYKSRQDNLGTCKLRQDDINFTLTNTKLNIYKHVRL